VKDKILSIVNGKPRDDSFYEAALSTWPDRLTKAEVYLAQAPKDSPMELVSMLSIARGRSFQALKMAENEKVRQMKLRGEYVEEAEAEAQRSEDEDATLDAQQAARDSTGSDEENEMRSDEDNEDDDIDDEQSDDEEENSEEETSEVGDDDI
jgi:hypothetical protein